MDLEQSVWLNSSTSKIHKIKINWTELTANLAKTKQIIELKMGAIT